MSKLSSAEELESLQFLRDYFTAHPVNVDQYFELNDALFLRYLRARRFNKEKALEMIKNTIEWRQNFGHADIESWWPVIQRENAKGKAYIRGFDKDGHVIMYFKPANEVSYNFSDNLKHIVYTLERAFSAMSNSNRGKDGEKVVLLIDYINYSFQSSPPLKTTSAIISILQNHYPERLLRAYCLRPPWVFSTILATISPFLDPVTRAKVVMCGHNKKEIVDKLAHSVDPGVLEASIGGHDDRAFDCQTYLMPPPPGGRSTLGEDDLHAAAFRHEFKAILDGDVVVPHNASMAAAAPAGGSLTASAAPATYMVVEDTSRSYRLMRSDGLSDGTFV